MASFFDKAKDFGKRAVKNFTPIGLAYKYGIEKPREQRRRDAVALANRPSQSLSAEDVSATYGTGQGFSTGPGQVTPGYYGTTQDGLPAFTRTPFQYKPIVVPKGLSPAAAKAYEQAEAAKQERQAALFENEQNLQQMLGLNAYGRQQNADFFRQYGQAGRADVDRSRQQQLAQGRSSLIARGLNNSTIRDTTERGIESESSRNLRDYNDRLAAMSQDANNRNLAERMQIISGINRPTLSFNELTGYGSAPTQISAIERQQQQARDDARKAQWMNLFGNLGSAAIQGGAAALTGGASMPATAAVGAMRPRQTYGAPYQNFTPQPTMFSSPYGGASGYIPPQNFANYA